VEVSTPEPHSAPPKPKPPKPPVPGLNINPPGGENDQGENHDGGSHGGGDHGGCGDKVSRHGPPHRVPVGHGGRGNNHSPPGLFKKRHH
jgi:hypothetical protein